MTDRARPIVSRPDVQNGEPCVSGTRITVRVVQDFLRAGYSIGAVVREYPDLTPLDVEACGLWQLPPERHPLTIRLDGAAMDALWTVHREDFPRETLEAVAERLLRDALIGMGVLPLGSENRGKGARSGCR